MKKARVFLLIFSILCLILCLASCDDKSHTHEWGVWSVTTPATCGAAGEQISTCTCGAVQKFPIPATGAHTWGEWETVTPATCGAVGEQTSTCACGAVQTLPIPATGAHTWGAWQQTVVATCTVQGQLTSTCACGAVQRQLLGLDAANHTEWGTWQQTTAPTCIAKGEETRTCACGFNDKRDLASTPNVHAYNAENTCANCLHYLDEGVIFARIDDEYHVVSYTGTATSVVIPSKYQNVPVTLIDYGAFMYCKSLTSVIIPNSVTLIGDNVFEGCIGLTSVTIPSSVAVVGSLTFAGCTSLTSITIPASVTSIGFGVFSHCTSLERITVDSGNTVYHSAGNCLIETATKLLIAGCKNSVIPTDGSVTTINHSAFAGCVGLTSITFPKSVTDMGDAVFAECTGLTSVTILGALTSIGGSAFTGCTGLTSVDIPNSVIVIGDFAFSGCTGLTSVTIPDSVSDIGKSAFEGCTGLVSLILPASELLYIRSSAFRGCTGLTSIVVPDVIISFGSYAFADCINLGSIAFPTQCEVLDNVLHRCDALKSISGPWRVVMSFLGEGLSADLAMDFVYDSAFASPDFTVFDLYDDFAGFYSDVAMTEPFDFEAWLADDRKDGDSVTLYARLEKPCILLPMQIEAKRFEEKILKPLEKARDEGRISARDYAWFCAWFSLMEQGSPGVAQTYPITAQKGIDIYVCESYMTLEMLRKVEAFVLNYTDYTFEDLAADYEFVEYQF